MSLADQTSLISTPDDTAVTLDTSGRVIRPLIAVPAALVDEMRLSWDGDGLHGHAVDPANVGMVEFHAPASAFESYDLDADLLVGMNLKTLQRQLQDARLGKRTDDPVSIVIDGRSTRLTIDREYADTRVRRTGEFLNIDPDAVRKNDPPDIVQGWEATVDVAALADTVEHVDGVTNHATIRERDGDLIISGSETTEDDEVSAASETVFEGVAERADESVDGAAALYSLDYVKDMVSGLKNAKVDRVTVAWDDEFPAEFRFERTQDGETLYHGRYLLAPRISDSGGQR